MNPRLTRDPLAGNLPSVYWMGTLSRAAGWPGMIKRELIFLGSAGGGGVPGPPGFTEGIGAGNEAGAGAGAGMGIGSALGVTGAAEGGTVLPGTT
ncbi:MAG: hypothetical protein ACKOS8_09380, partial [Gemmataceae bacterium]